MTVPIIKKLKEMDKKDLTFKEKAVRAYNKKAEEVGKDQLNQNLKDFGINVLLFVSYPIARKNAIRLACAELQF